MKTKILAAGFQMESDFYAKQLAQITIQFTRNARLGTSPKPEAPIGSELPD